MNKIKVPDGLRDRLPAEPTKAERQTEKNRRFGERYSTTEVIAKRQPLETQRQLGYDSQTVRSDVDGVVITLQKVGPDKVTLELARIGDTVISKRVALKLADALKGVW